MFREVQPMINVHDQNLNEDLLGELILQPSIDVITGVTYKGMVEILGPPTIHTPNGNGLTEKTWVIEYKGELFMIYDFTEDNIFDNDEWVVNTEYTNRDLSEELCGYIFYIMGINESCEQLKISLEN